MSGGGGPNSTPPSDTPPGGGIYRTDTQNVLNAIGKGMQKADFSPKPLAQGSGLSNFQSGSGSPFIGGGRSMSADEPQSYQIQPPPPNQVSDFQKQYYDIVGKIYQSYQQRVQNEGFGQGQFGM